MRVLVIEDSAPTRDLLVRSLADAGMTVTTAARVSTGLRTATTAEFDVIVLDLMLPDGDGLDLCRELRAGGTTTPILCLTARAEVADRVEGLEAGADDYVRKPFALAELQARIRALARRLTRAGSEVPLTAREWAVLGLLASRAGRLVTRAELLEHAWHDTTPAASDSLDVILSRLRRKLGRPEEGCGIRTVRGEGFVFETAP